MPYEIDVAAPYRLDLTISVLRRLSANVVDVLTPQGQYLRALTGLGGPVLARVTQRSPSVLDVVLEGEHDEHPRALALLHRMLGVERDLAPFYQATQRIAWLEPLAIRMRGVKPPRYPTLWEACVNAILFQQVSLHAASAILRRLIATLGPPLSGEGMTLHAFPSAAAFGRASDELLLRAGLNAAKLATLRRVGEALLSVSLDETALQQCSSPEAAARLREIKGIGPWTATVILLRGLGRLDVFPMNDSSVARNLAFVARPGPLDIGHVLETLGSQRGMLYYHLLLARLEERGEIGRASRYRS